MNDVNCFTVQALFCSPATPRPFQAAFEERRLAEAAFRLRAEAAESAGDGHDVSAFPVPST